MGKIAVLCHVENWMMTVFSRLLISSIHRTVPNMFVFLNLCELRETTDLEGEDVPERSCTSCLVGAGL